MLRVLVALVLLSGVAHAGEVEARALYDSGRAKYEAGDWEGALAEFDAGFQEAPSPAFLVNAAQCLRRLDRLEDAAVAYKRFLDLRAGDSRLRGEVWEALDEVLTDLEGRLFLQAKDALYLRAFLDGGTGTAEERAQAARALATIIDRLVKVDDTLTIGLGRVHLLSLPDPMALLITRTTP